MVLSRKDNKAIFVNNYLKLINCLLFRIRLATLTSTNPISPMPRRSSREGPAGTAFIATGPVNDVEYIV